MEAIKELKDEHQAIKLTLKILDRIVGQTEKNRRLDNPDHLEQLLEFFQIFVDKCHHGKEEELLFPALEKLGVTWECGPEGDPIEMLLSEHRQGRIYVKEMSDALNDCRKEDRELSRLLSTAREYIALLNPHIETENNIIFPVAVQHLNSTIKSELKEGFERLENEKIGAGKHEAFHELLDRLKEIYLK